MSRATYISRKKRNRETCWRQSKALKTVQREAKRKLVAQPEISHEVAEAVLRGQAPRTDEKFPGIIHVSHQPALLHGHENVFFCTQCGAVTAGGSLRLLKSLCDEARISSALSFSLTVYHVVLWPYVFVEVFSLGASTACSRTAVKSDGTPAHASNGKRRRGNSVLMSGCVLDLVLRGAILLVLALGRFVFFLVVSLFRGTSAVVAQLWPGGVDGRLLSFPTSDGRFVG